MYMSKCCNGDIDLMHTSICDYYRCLKCYRPTEIIEKESSND
jgi:hypothetical protein